MTVNGLDPTISHRAVETASAVGTVGPLAGRLLSTTAACLAILPVYFGIRKRTPMANVFDVADHILHKIGKVSSMKLQKLVFYSQAWSLVWDEKPLFDNRIEAWANGPVTPDLYHEHKGNFIIAKVPTGNRRVLTAEQRETVDAVLETYGNKSATWLSALTHSEAPWQQARGSLADGERGQNAISLGSLADYYGNL